MPDRADSTYPIGYKRPPSHTQFKPGQSGNTNGRPKGAKNFATIFQEELHAKIEVTENGKRKQISKRQAIVKQHVNKAAAGDAKAATVVLNEVRSYETQGQSPVGQGATASPEDQVVMGNIVRRIQQLRSASLDSEAQPDPLIEDGTDSSPDPDQGGA